MPPTQTTAPSICSARARAVMIGLPFEALRVASQAAIDLVRGDEIAMVEAEAAAGIHHFVGGGRKRHRAAELAAELEREQHVLLLQRDVGERYGRHLSLENERAAISQHRRGGN